VNAAQLLKNCIGFLQFFGGWHLVTGRRRNPH
jgi:hypothetical protein